MSPAPLPPPKRMIVFGAGALGSLFGAQLSAQIPVVLVGRPAHVEAINVRGLAIETPDASGSSVTRTVQGPRLRAATEIPPLQNGDVIGVFCKAADSLNAGEVIGEAIIAFLRDHYAAMDKKLKAAQLSEAITGRRVDVTYLLRVPEPVPPPVWTFQNGVSNAVVLAGVIGDTLEVDFENLFTAIASQGATLVEPGRVADFGGGYVMPETPEGQCLGGVMARAGMAVRYTRTMPVEAWTKLAVNCVVNPLTLLLQRRNKFILTPELAALRRTVVEEVVAIAAAEKIELNATEVIAKMEAAMAVSLNYSSMYQDWLRYQEKRAAWEKAGGVGEAPALRTEIEALNGLILDLSVEHDIPVPANETLLSLVKFYEPEDGM